MKRIRPDATAAPALVMRESVYGTRSSASLGAILATSRGAAASRCLRCVDEPCVHFGTSGSASADRIQPVCPTDAIRSPRAASGPTITDACFGCGLCAMRCPVGAVSVATGLDALRAVVEPPDATDQLYVVEEDHDLSLAYRDELVERIKWSNEELDQLAETLFVRSASLRQAQFYPLVAALLTVAGFPVWRPVQGDTNNRIDLILVDDGDSLPVEIKSRTEVPVINVKSVQQALENKIILDERAFLQSHRDSSTLVVGYEYPPARSDVAELIDDIYKAFGIQVGLISMRQLYRMAIACVLTGRTVSRSTLSSLRGQL